MVKFGICNSLNNSSTIKAAGWDFVEENVQGLFKGQETDQKYDGQARVASSVLPVAAANCLLPGSMKITGASIDLAGLEAYMTNVLRRADAANCRRLVFGSGGARQVPDGWDKTKATQQIVAFGSMAASIAAKHNVTLVLEHLCTKECNIVNTLAEELTIVQQVNHPNFRALLDTYHFWMDARPMAELEPLLPFIQHVHLADKDGRVPPGESGKSDYRPIFKLLKKADYSGMLSVEAAGFNDLATMGPRVLAFLKKQWADA